MLPCSGHRLDELHRVIPWPAFRHFGKCLSAQWIARQQERPPFHPAGLVWHNGPKDTNCFRARLLSRGPVLPPALFTSHMEPPVRRRSQRRVPPVYGNSGDGLLDCLAFGSYRSLKAASKEKILPLCQSNTPRFACGFTWQVQPRLLGRPRWGFGIATSFWAYY